MSVVNCQIEIPTHQTQLGAADAELTVGRQFLLQCDGEWPELDSKKLELRLEAADKYKLHLMEFQKTGPGHAQLLVSSYKAGEHKLKAVQLVDPEHSVVLGDLSFTVKSVLDPKQPESEPFGPMGPITFGLPWYYFAVPIVILATLALWGFFGWRRRSQKKRLIAEMNLSRSVLSPIAELSHKMRQVLRATHHSPLQDLMTQINEAFRIYLARKFLIPTLVWNDGLILKDFKKNFSAIYEVCGTEVAQVLVELNRGRAAGSKIELKDIEQMLSHVRKASEAIEKQFLVQEKN